MRNETPIFSPSEEELRSEYARLGWNWDPTREPSADHLKAIQLKLAQPLPTINMTAPQLLGFNYGRTHPKFILSLDKGMGKTVLYLAIGLEGEPEYVIIVCPTRAMAGQRREILRHFPGYHGRWIFVRGQAPLRYRQWRAPEARIFICTAATFQADIGGREIRGRTSDVIAPPWALSSHLDHLSIDEFHKYIRRRSKTWEQLKKLSPHTLIPDSGSAVSNSPADLWPALNLVNRKKYSSYWKYVDDFCETIPGFRNQGKEIIGPKFVEQWRAYTAPEVFHRKKDPRDYPPKSRFFMDLELPDWQRKLHDGFREQLMAEYESSTGEMDFLVARNQGDALYRARLSLICPKALDPALGVGEGIEAIADDGEDLSHYVITTPFRAPIPHLKDYIQSTGRRVWILAGGLGIDPDEQDRIISDFESTGGTLIQTTKYATSYEFIHGPEHNYCLGYEFDPEDNKQAEDRMQRVSSTRPSFHWYVRFAGTYDEDLMDRIIMKAQNANTLLDKGKYWDHFK